MINIILFFGCFCRPKLISYRYLKILYVFSITRLIGQAGRVFTNGPGDLGSISDRVIPKILKMLLDTALVNT